MGSFSRREFLGESLLAAAAASAIPALPALASPVRRAGPNDRLRVAVVGVRGQGFVHVKRWSKLSDCEVVALCDPDANVVGEPSKTVEKESGRKPRWEADVRKLLEDKTIDVVSIATPNHWHVLASFWAVQAGKDVYVEKPLGHNVVEQRRLVQLADKTGRLVQMGNYTRSNGHTRSGIEFLRSGKLGKVSLARAIFYSKRGSIGKKPDGEPPPGVDYDLWTGPAPLRPFNPNRFHYNWHWNWDYGGGEIANNGVYFLDTARWGLGKDGHPARVASVGGRLGYEDDGQTPNTHLVVYDYGDARIVHEIRGLESDKYRDVATGTIFQGEKGHGVFTTAGTAVFSEDGKLIERFGGTGDHFRVFADAVKARKRELLTSDVLEGHLSTSLCHFGNISHRLGAPKPLSEVKDFGGDAGAEAVDRLRAHLKGHGLEGATVAVGRPLEIVGEKFKDAPEADALLGREYRKPYVVPDSV
jgi:predicted dehydrogenase